MFCLQLPLSGYYAAFCEKSLSGPAPGEANDSVTTSSTAARKHFRRHRPFISKMDKALVHERTSSARPDRLAWVSRSQFADRTATKERKGITYVNPELAFLILWGRICKVLQIQPMGWSTNIACRTCCLTYILSQTKTRKEDRAHPSLDLLRAAFYIHFFFPLVDIHYQLDEQRTRWSTFRFICTRSKGLTGNRNTKNI